MVDLGGEALVAQHQRRVGEADRHLGDVLHLHQHVDGPVEVGQGRLFRRLRGVPLRCAGHGRSVEMPAAAPWRNNTSPGRTISSPVISVIQSRSRRMATTRSPATVGSSRVGERPVGHVRSVADPHAVGDLLGPGQVCDQRPRDAQTAGDHPGDVGGGVADPLDGADDLQYRRHGVGVARRPGGQHRDGPHLVDKIGEPLLQLVDLLGHVRIAEVERGIGQVDHQLGGVLGLREHRLEIAWSVVHGGVPQRYAMPTITMARIRAKAPRRSIDDVIIGMP